MDMKKKRYLYNIVFIKSFFNLYWNFFNIKLEERNVKVRKNPLDFSGSQYCSDNSLEIMIWLSL